MTSLIESLVPPTVAVSTVYGDIEDTELFLEEQAVVKHAVTKRRQEFATVRHCARQALSSLGLSAVPILPGDMGAPQWPASVVGSMTHCEGFRAAAVGLRSEYVTIGIDAEPHGRLPEGILESIARPEEIEALHDMGWMASDVCWDRLLFSAKESVYKAWFPLTGTWLGFEEASILFTRAGRFRARLLPADAPFRHFDGRWSAADGLVATAVVLSRTGKDAAATVR